LEGSGILPRMESAEFTPFGAAVVFALATRLPGEPGGFDAR